MEGLIKNLMEQANLEEGVAEKVLDVVKSYVEEKLPAPIASQVVKALDGVDGDDLGDALDMAKGLFGK